MVDNIVLLAPRGAEYQAVRRSAAGLSVHPVGLGRAAAQDLEALLESPPSRVILLGLGGSLSPAHGPGDVLIWRSAIHLGSGQRQRCDRASVRSIRNILATGGITAPEVNGLTSDRVICAAAEKQRLGSEHKAAGVDMEGYWVLERLAAHNIAAAVVRVISDGVDGNIPDLSPAIQPDGTLRPLALTATMGRSPQASLRLIRGSLRGLAVLQRVAEQLATIYGFTASRLG